MNDIFPYVRTRPVDEIKPLVLLNVLRKIEKRGSLAKVRKVLQRSFLLYRTLAGKLQT